MGRWHLSLLVALLFAACGGGAESTPTPVQSPSTSPTPTATPEPPTATPVPPVLLYFVTQGPYGSVIHQIAVDDLASVPEALPIQLPFAEVALSPRGGVAAVAPPGVEPADILLVDLVSPFAQQNISQTPELDETAPFFSADGEYLAARLANADGAFRIRWYTLASGMAATADLGDIEPVDLRWLPDGQGFSYVLDGAATVFAFGSGQRTFNANAGYEAREFAFSPDGERAAVIQVERAPTATAEPTSATDPETTPEVPNDSPTDQHEPDWRLSVIDEQGLVVATLAPAYSGLSGLRWQFDGEDLVTFHGTNGEGVTGLWAISPGRSPVLIYEGRVDDSAWSPGGRYVAVVADGGDCNMRTCPRGFLRVVDTLTGEVYRWDSNRVLSRPAWGN
ncbi:MAG: PD40 domain-containing protein [Dehalococcoidia bacterium]|nr:PD40 domain-containing protein [Dehalococcoidia bacterium]